MRLLVVNMYKDRVVFRKFKKRILYGLPGKKVIFKNWDDTKGIENTLKNKKIQGIKSNVDVFFDERLVPHVYADNNADAYFTQGYLHAKFRLWQMEFQTYVAAGRLSEIVGEDRLATDKYFRRLGMVYGAENSMKATESDPATKEACDAYTAGVNAYITALQPENLPFEYKLLNYKPEPWTNLKTALFLKFMSWDLSGQGDDLTYTNAKAYFGYDDYMKLSCCE